MITVDVEKVLRELQEYKKTVDRKLAFMVREFVYAISQEAINNTPLGDSNAYMSWYQSRIGQPEGLQPIHGLARGSWQVNTTGTFSQQQIYGSDSGDLALVQVRTDINSYKLGDTVYISNTGYYITALENNHSMQTFGKGIVAPTTEAIMSIYQLDLKRLFDAG